MIRGAEDQDLYSDYYDGIQSVEVKQAYCFLVGWASTLRGYDCFPGVHGYIRDFRFMRDNEWDFAFIPNQKWLLFYFRAPCLQHPKYTRQAIIERFPEAKETGSGEFTVRLTNLSDALRVSSYIGS